MNHKKLIILKISGASLKGEKDIININFLNEIARQIKFLSSNFKVAIVLGGGNIWRGNIAKEIGMQRNIADQIGMLATVMNSLALQSVLINHDVKTKVFSTIEMEKVAETYIIRNLEKALDQDEVVLLSCGTGRPYFTTDTGIAVSAAELGATYIMMGKNNVDGVYDSDPNLNSSAKFYSHLSYTKIIEDDLEVMDITAASICQQYNIKTIVFKINVENAFVNVLNKNAKFTLISENESDLDNFYSDFNTLSFGNYFNKSKTFNNIENIKSKDYLEFYIKELQKLSDSMILNGQKKLNVIVDNFEDEKSKGEKSANGMKKL